MFQPCEPLRCMLGSHGVKAPQCKTTCIWWQVCSWDPTPSWVEEWHFSGPRVPLESLNKHLPWDVGLEYITCWGLFLPCFSRGPSQYLACSLSQPMPRFTEMLERTVWARGCPQSAAQPRLPCFRGKRRVHAYGGELWPDRWPQG